MAPIRCHHGEDSRRGWSTGTVNRKACARIGPSSRCVQAVYRVALREESRLRMP